MCVCVLNARAGRTIIQEENRSILRLPLRKKRKEKKKESKEKENSMHGKMTTANRKEKRVVKSTNTLYYYFKNVYEH